MDLSDQIKSICKQNNIALSRSKGQNFLIDEDVYDKIVELADLDANDVVLEVGPGLGYLTERLARKVKRVVAVELDDKLAVVLREKFKEQNVSNVEIVNENILELRITNYELRTKEYKVVANLPYNITSIFLRKFLSGENWPQSMTLLLQKEVAERIVAKPGEMSVLAVSVQYYANPKILGYVSRDKFWPAPAIDSAIIKIDLKNDLDRSSVDKEKDFFRLVKIGFSSRRKMLKNNLMAGLGISQEMAKDKIKSAGLDEKIRAQDLSLSDWQNLFVQFG
jgi:16S rRNA (adenine1518-N6/adenine1519-N6)-dimethyltransferase